MVSKDENIERLLRVKSAGNKIFNSDEEALRLQAAMLQNVPEGIFLIGLDDGIIKYTNHRFAGMFGYGEGELLGENVAILNAPVGKKSPEDVRDEISNVLKTSGEWHDEVKSVRKDSTYFWCYVDASLFDHPDFGRVIISVHTDISEKKNADLALQEQTDLLATVFESSPNILMLVDAEGRVEKINRVGSEFAGSPQEELIGLLGGDVFRCVNSFEGKGCGRNPECAECPVRTLVTRTIQKGDALINEEGRLTVWKGAREIPMDFLISTVPVNVGEVAKVLVTIVDISERKQAEHILHRYMSELEALYESAGTINRLQEPSQVGQKIVEVLGRHLSWHHVTVRLRHEESDELEVVACGQPGILKRDKAKVLKNLNSMIGKVGEGLSGYSIQTGVCIRAANVKEYPNYIETYPGIQSGLYAPLKLGERVIGNICVESEKPGAFSAHDEQLLMTLAAQAATAFENARLYQNLQSELKERKRTEEALRESEFQNRTILQTALDGFWIVDPKTARILDVNNAYCRMSGYSREELLQMSIVDLEAVESGEDIFNRNQQVISSGGDRFESIHNRKDGSSFHVEVSVQNLEADGGRNFAFIHDITERKQAEQSLKESEEQYRLLFDEMLSGFALHEIICDKKGIPVDYRFLAVNAAFEQLTGLKAKDIIGKTVLEVMPDTEHFWIERYGKVALEETADQFEGFSAAIGKHYEARAFSPEKGKFAVMFHDVTERKQAEDELRLNEENLRITLQSIGDAVIATDLEGRIVRMNSVAESLTGWEIAKAIHKPLTEVFRIVNATTRKEAENPVIRVLETGQVVGLANHTSLLARDGNEYQIADSAAPIRDKDGQIQGVILVFSNVSEKYKAEEALRRSEEGLKKAQHFAKVGSWTWDITSNRLEWSDEMYDIFGIDKRTFTGYLPDVIASAIHPDDRAKVEESNQSVVSEGKPIPVEYRVIRPDGSGLAVWAEAGELIKNKNGDPVFLSGIVQDITERKQTEEKLKRLLKEKEILLAEVHHRVKNNLQVVTSLLNLQTEGVDDERILDILDKSRARIQSMTLVHEQLYRSREYAHIDFGIYTDQLVSTLFNMYEVDPGQIEFELDVEEVYLDLEKAIPCGLLLTELITNSLKYAFPSGKKGKLWVRLNPKGEKMILEVGDNGIGIPDDIDFETTKSLGLQLVNLLTTHDLQGTVEIRRKKGAEYCVEFPVRPKNEE